MTYVQVVWGTYLVWGTYYVVWGTYYVVWGTYVVWGKLYE